MAEWWTNTSLEPSSGVTNPYPFWSLNHLTVPRAMYNSPPSRVVLCLEPVDDPALRQIVRGEHQTDAVALEDAAGLVPDLPCDIRHHKMAVPDLDAESQVAQSLDHRALNANAFLFRHGLTQRGCAGSGWKKPRSICSSTVVWSQ